MLKNGFKMDFLTQLYTCCETDAWAFKVCTSAQLLALGN